MRCSICFVEVQGDVFVSEDKMNGTCIIRMEASPDRDWIACDACNALVCNGCCTHPESGYCDGCIAKYRLRTYLMEEGLIRESRMRGKAAGEDH
jgi:hypothetical protein